MYVKRTRYGQGWANTVLCEMTAAELRAARAEPEAQGEAPSVAYRPCGADSARAWVDSGRIHETGLYRDYDGRIRYARGEPC